MPELTERQTLAYKQNSVAIIKSFSKHFVDFSTPFWHPTLSNWRSSQLNDCFYFTVLNSLIIIWNLNITYVFYFCLSLNFWMIVCAALSSSSSSKSFAYVIIFVFVCLSHVIFWHDTFKSSWLNNNAYYVSNNNWNTF